jgi:hypothetical protein
MKYQSPLQLVLFEMPFDQQLDPENRFVRLSRRVPWDELDALYRKVMSDGQGGGHGLTSRMVFGSMIIKHMHDLSDEGTVAMIHENPYAQYFVGLTSFSKTRPFDPSALTYFRKRLNWESLQDLVLVLVKKAETAEGNDDGPSSGGGQQIEAPDDNQTENVANPKGEMIIDSTVFPQNIHYPTDVRLLHECRLASEAIIDYACTVAGLPRPRTYRKQAQKDYMSFARKRKPNAKTVRKAKRTQLGYLGRNIRTINSILDLNMGRFGKLFARGGYKIWLVIQEVYRQQLGMYQSHTNRCMDRIVNIKQPHVRPIVRGKQPVGTEFGSKVCVFIDHLGLRHVHDVGWDASHDGADLIPAAERYRKTYGHYPRHIKADGQYRTKANRDWCNSNEIILSGKGPGRPPKDTSTQTKEKPGERNAIEGTFGHGKQHKGLARVRAKLKNTSEVWVAFTYFVINLEKILSPFAYLAVRGNLWRAITPQNEYLDKQTGAKTVIKPLIIVTEFQVSRHASLQKAA